MRDLLRQKIVDPLVAMPPKMTLRDANIPAVHGKAVAVIEPGNGFLVHSQLDLDASAKLFAVETNTTADEKRQRILVRRFCQAADARPGVAGFNLLKRTWGPKVQKSSTLRPCQCRSRLYWAGHKETVLARRKPTLPPRTTWPDPSKSPRGFDADSAV